MPTRCNDCRRFNPGEIECSCGSRNLTKVGPVKEPNKQQNTPSGDDLDRIMKEEERLRSLDMRSFEQQLEELIKTFKDDIKEARNRPAGSREKDIEHGRTS